MYHAAEENCSRDLVGPGIRALGNILVGTHDQTQIALDHGTFTVLKKYFSLHRRDGIMQDICWALSNIAADLPNHFQLILDDEELLASVSSISLPDSPHQSGTKLHACYVLANLSQASTTTDQIKKFATIPWVPQALFFASFHTDSILRNRAWNGFQKVLRQSGCLACIQSIKEAPVEDIQNILERRPLERLLRSPGIRDKTDLATVFAGLGCSPSAKVFEYKYSLSDICFAGEC